MGVSVIEGFVQAQKYEIISSFWSNTSQNVARERNSEASRGILFYIIPWLFKTTDKYRYNLGLRGKENK